MSWASTSSVIGAVLLSNADIALLYSPILISLFAFFCFRRSICEFLGMRGVRVSVGALGTSGWWGRCPFLVGGALSCSIRSPSLQHSSIFPAIHCSIIRRCARIRDSLFFRPPLVGNISTTFSLAHASSAVYASSSVLADANLSNTQVKHCPHRRRSWGERLLVFSCASGLLPGCEQL